MTSSRPKFYTAIRITDSDWIDTIQYDPNTWILDANLRNGTRYRYLKVPARIFADVLTAKSSGKAFNKHIKGKFTSKKLPPKRRRFYGFYLTRD